MDRIGYVPHVIYRENLFTRRTRRVIDVTLALAILVIAIPVMALAALAIFLEDGGPVFFRQRRAGRFERLFTIVKLRTMKLDRCEDGPSPSSDADDRITRVGKYIRKTSIDELPQLFNVLAGHMSLIGPRPEMALIMRRYEKWQHLRHLVAPGITGIWQTTCRKTIPLHRPEATALDLDYIMHASPVLDSVLLLRTVGTLVFSKGAF